MKIRYAVMLASGLTMMVARGALADESAGADAPATGMEHKATRPKSTASTSPGTRLQSPTGKDSKSMTGTTATLPSSSSASTDATKRQGSPTGQDSESMTQFGNGDERPDATASTDAMKRQESPTGEDSRSMTQFGNEDAQARGKGSSDVAENAP